MYERQDDVRRVAARGHVGEAVASDVVIVRLAVGADFAAADGLPEHEISQGVAPSVREAVSSACARVLGALDCDPDERLCPRC